MKITLNTVASIEYTLTDDSGEVLDSSTGREPLTYVHGVGGLIPGLESELEGKIAGDALKVRIAPADGYGERDEALVKFDDEAVWLDANHPLAGVHLNFEVKVVTVRKATREELDHGHVHGPGGHHH